MKQIKMEDLYDRADAILAEESLLVRDMAGVGLRLATMPSVPGGTELNHACLSALRLVNDGLSEALNELNSTLSYSKGEHTK